MASPVRDITSARSMYAGAPASKTRQSKAVDLEWCLQEIADAETEKNQLVGTWRSAIDLFMPQRQGFGGDKVAPGRIPQEKFESAPEESVKRGGGNVIAAFCPAGSNWMEYVPGNGVDDRQKKDLSKGMEAITEAIFDYLHRSLFDRKLNSGSKDLMLSMLFMTIDEGTIDKPFRVNVASLDECYPVLNQEGEIENVYRKYQCRPQHIARNYPAGKISGRIQQMITAKSREKVTIVEATTFEPGRGFRYTVFDPSDKFIILDIEPDDPLAPSRWITPRLDTFAGFAYGNGPVVRALSTCRTLNKERELYLKGMAKAVAPPTIFDRRAGINPNTVRLGANTVGMYDGQALAGAVPAIQLPPAGGFDLCMEDIRENRAIIDDILFATPDIPPPEDFKGRSATETQVRKQMVLQQRGVDIGTLQNELPMAVMNRCFYIASKLGCLTRFGIKKAVTVDGKYFDVKPLGPLAQAQRAEKARAKLQFISDARAAAGDQVVALQLKVEDMIGNAARDSGAVDESEIRDDGEKEQIQKQAAQVAAMQAAGQGPSLDPSNLPGLGS